MFDLFKNREEKDLIKTVFEMTRILQNKDISHSSPQYMIFSNRKTMALKALRERFAGDQDGSAIYALSHAMDVAGYRNEKSGYEALMRREWPRS